MPEELWLVTTHVFAYQHINLPTRCFSLLLRLLKIEVQRT